MPSSLYCALYHSTITKLTKNIPQYLHVYSTTNLFDRWRSLIALKPVHIRLHLVSHLLDLLHGCRQVLSASPFLRQVFINGLHFGELFIMDAFPVLVSCKRSNTVTTMVFIHLDEMLAKTIYEQSAFKVLSFT